MARRMRVVISDGRKRDEDHATRVLGIACAVLLPLLVIGTFFDLPISRAIALAAGNPLVIVTSTLGLPPMMFLLCVMGGPFFERLWGDRMKPDVRVAATCACLILVLMDGYIGFPELFVAQGLGPLLPFTLPMPVKIMGGVLYGLAFAGFGYMGAEANADPMFVRRLAIVVIALMVLFALAMAAKNVMRRPRYRLVRHQVPGVEYLRWLKRCTAANELVADPGIDRDEFLSFQIANAVQYAALMASYFGLMALFPTLRAAWRMRTSARSRKMVAAVTRRPSIATSLRKPAPNRMHESITRKRRGMQAILRIPAAPVRSYLEQV